MWNIKDQNTPHKCPWENRFQGTNTKFNTVISWGPNTCILNINKNKLIS